MTMSASKKNSKSATALVQVFYLTIYPQVPLFQRTSSAVAPGDFGSGMVSISGEAPAGFVVDFGSGKVSISGLRELPTGLVVLGTVSISGEATAGLLVFGTVSISGEAPAGLVEDFVSGKVSICGEAPTGLVVFGTLLISEDPAGLVVFGTVSISG